VPAPFVGRDLVIVEYGIELCATGPTVIGGDLQRNVHCMAPHDAARNTSTGAKRVVAIFFTVRGAVWSSTEKRERRHGEAHGRGAMGTPQSGGEREGLRATHNPRRPQ
jgi:hypothetical protein